jgi:hypothetical protein
MKLLITALTSVLLVTSVQAADKYYRGNTDDWLLGYDISQDIADSNNYDTLQTLLENLMVWDIEMDILDTETKTIVLRTNDYNPPKEHGRAK